MSEQHVVELSTGSAGAGDKAGPRAGDRLVTVVGDRDALSPLRRPMLAAPPPAPSTTGAGGLFGIRRKRTTAPSIAPLGSTPSTGDVAPDAPPIARSARCIPRWCVWAIPAVLIAIGLAVTLPIARARQLAAVDGMKADLTRHLGSSPCLASWSGDFTSTLTFLRDLTEMATGGLAMTRAAPSGMPQEMSAAFVALSRRSLSVRQRRDTVAAYGEWVLGPDRAAFEARMNARIATNRYVWTPTTYFISVGGAPTPNASEYLAASDLLMGNLSAVFNGLNYHLDPVRGPLAQASRRANALLLGTPIPSLVTNRTIVPVSMPIFSPANDMPTGHAQYFLPLFTPANESRYAFRGSIVGSVFNSIDDCALAVPGIVALHDITGTPAGLQLVNASLSALVVGPVPVAPPTDASAPGEIFIQTVRDRAFSTQAAYAAALQRTRAAAPEAVLSWAMSAGFRVWRLTLIADTGDLEAAAALQLDTLAVVVGVLVYLTAALLAAALLWIAVYWDLRRMGRHERAMTAQHMAAKAMQVAYVFHELRVPLNSITLGLLDLLEDAAMPAAFHSLLRTLKQAADGMIVIVSDMLDLSRMERGEYTMRPVPMVVSVVATEAVQRMAPFASEFSVAMVADAASVVGLTVWADPARVQQILTNLLSNAVKFAPHDGSGTVTLRVTQRPCPGVGKCSHAAGPLLAATGATPTAQSPTHRSPSPAPPPEPRVSSGGMVVRGRTSGQGASRASSVNSSAVASAAPTVAQLVHLLFEVEDNGCGIPAHEVGLLFKPFVQLAAGEAYKGRGTGLGLAITRNIAARHQGAMAVRSQEGVGSVFSLDLHVALLEGGAGVGTLRTGSVENATVAMDESVGLHDTRRRWRVGRIGAEVTSPPSSPARSSDAAAHSTAAVVAIGVSVTSTAGDAPSPVGGPPPSLTAPAGIVVGGSATPAGGSGADVTDGFGIHSAHAHGHDSNECINVSMSGTAADSYVASPTVGTLAAAGAAAGAAATADAVSSPTISAARREHRSWLMVDDVETNVKLLTRLLQRRCRGDEFVVVLSGAAALAELDRRGVAGFDIIVCDKEMPGIDGHAVAQRARARGFRGLLLGCTGNAMPRDRELFMAAGADEVVFKPVDIDAMLRLVEDFGWGAAAGGVGGGGAGGGADTPWLQLAHGDGGGMNGHGGAGFGPGGEGCAHEDAYSHPRVSLPGDATHLYAS